MNEKKNRKKTFTFLLPFVLSNEWWLVMVVLYVLKVLNYQALYNYKQDDD